MFFCLSNSIQILERLVFDLSDTHSRIHSALQPIHTRLIEIKRELQNLLRRPFHAFTLSEVTGLQDELREIDDARIDGKFFSLNQEIIPGKVDNGETHSIRILHSFLIFSLSQIPPPLPPFLSFSLSRSVAPGPYQGQASVIDILGE